MSRVKNIVDLKNYVSPKYETSYYKNVPIQYLDIARSILKSHGFTCKIRYRGPRKNDGRNSFNKRSTCLKQNAVTFTVYSI